MADTIKITTLAQLKVALQAAKTYIDGQIGGLGTLAGKSEVAYDDLAAALKTLIDGKAAQATVDTLVGEDTGKSVRTISSEEVAKIVAGADKSYDTLKEIADWILSDTTGAAKMANDITRLDGILAGIGGTDEEATVVAYVTKMIKALGIDDYVKTATMTTELGKKVDKVEGSRLMTNAEGTKLAGIAAGAQVNTVNIVVRSHLTPFGKTSGVCLDYNIMLQQFVGCRQYLNRVAGNDIVFALINITVQTSANRYR